MTDRAPKPAKRGPPQPAADQPAENAGYELARGPSAKGQQAGEYQFLPVQCPNCGMEGKVKISRLDRTFTCKQCKRAFYCALDGTVSGERPPDVVVDPAEMITEEPQDWLTKRLESLPRVWQVAILGVAGLAIAYGVSVWMEPVKPLPGEIEDRAVFAGKALGHGEWKQLKRLAKPKTAGDLGRWYDKVRPKAWADATAESSVNVEPGQVTQQLKGYEKEKPVLDAIVPVSIEVAGMPEESQLKDLPLRFSQDEHAEWWLDGERMLADTVLPKDAPKKHNPATKGVK